MSTPQPNETRPGIFEYRFDSADDFFEALSPTHAIWEDRPTRWIFRGHSDSDNWLLVPSAQRAEAWTKFGVTFDPAARTISEREEEENRVVAEFKAALTLAGEQTPEVGGVLLNPPGGMPPRLIALAQHRFVPTRFLDWTRSGWKAAYFAALRPEPSAAELAVWAIPGRLLTNPQRGMVEGIRTFDLFVTPRWENAYLHAQSGLFSCVELASTDPQRDCRLPPPLDEIVSDVCSGVRKHAGFSSGVPPYARMLKFVLSRSADERLMRLLHLHGISGLTMFPGAEGVTRYVRERLLFNIPDREDWHTY